MTLCMTKILIVNVEDKRATQDEIKKYNIRQNDIHIKFTANNNLMIHLKHLDDINKICDDGDIFSGNRKINLEAEDNNPIDIVIKNLSYAKEEEYQEILKKNGITKIIDFKSPRIIGAKCSNNNIKLGLIMKRLRLGYSFHRVEQYAKPVHVLQCMKCFEFNHKANECQNDTRCKNCSGLILLRTVLQTQQNAATVENNIKPRSNNVSIMPTKHLKRLIKSKKKEQKGKQGRLECTLR